MSLKFQNDLSLCLKTQGAFLLMLMSVMLLVLPSTAQRSDSHIPRIVSNFPGQDAFDSRFYSQSGMDSIRPEIRLQFFNADRQKKLVADTGKLLRLATELNAELSSANAATLNSSQLRKLSEIAKLAHSVKDKMSYMAFDVPTISMPE